MIKPIYAFLLVLTGMSSLYAQDEETERPEKPFYADYVWGEALNTSELTEKEKKADEVMLFQKK